MPDLTTTYLGMRLKNPLVVSASPFSKKVDRVKRLEEAGAAAVVMYSLFEEQITHESRELDYYLSRGTETYSEALSYFPDLERYNVGPESYLDHLHKVKQAVQIPVIGSLNGISSGGWTSYAQRIEEAGADALELNIYYLPTDPKISAATMERVYVQLVRDVCAAVKIPVALKLTPFFTSFPHVARRFVAAGAKGLVLFNRFYQPDFDLEAFEVLPTLELSTSQDLRLPLRWISILYGRIKADLALSRGVHTGQDVVKGVMAGANVVMIASELLAKGIGRMAEIEAELKRWMEEHEYESVTQMRGCMSQQAVAEPAAFERANYMKALSAFDNRLP